ncbi:MAG: hypothetical protein Q8P45_00880 [Candidatus Harrisonbacteria bacterium]|nr:hypothetical protein [Candidatus Harrisonbacteria bacterium]
MNKRSVWTIIIIVIVVLLLIFAFSRFQSTRDGGENGNGEPADENAIIIRDQNPEQLGATFDEVALTDPGFLVIHGVVNGEAGIVVGSSRLLQAGTHRDVQVLMELVPGQTYEVQIHLDDGNGVFDAATDLPVRTAAGVLITARFNVDEDDDFIGK